MKAVDLHVHSNRSDGTLSPTALVEYAMEKGLGAFALTDHDTIDGLEEALSHADSLRASLPLSQRDSVPEVIPGIEFSTEYEGRDVHIVGLYIDYGNETFQAHLQKFVASRIQRNEKMCKLLQEAGIDISYEKLLATFPNAVITRAHYAKYLLTHGYVTGMAEAFERYVGDHCPYFVPREKVTPQQAVSLILQAGGLPILAHPILYRMSDARLETLVSLLKDAGLMGIEAVYSTYNASEERQIRRLAAKYHLLISGGSDFHGENKPKLDLGVGYGKLFLPESILDEIKASLKKLLFTDMDGTLLRRDSTISPAMKEGIRRMTAAGHHLILSSGRPLPSILEVCEKEGLTFPHMLIISNNGSLIYDCDSRVPLLEHRICQEDIALITALAKEAGLHIHGYGQEDIVCLAPNKELAFYTRRIHLPLKCVENIAEALPQGSCKLQVISLDNHQALEDFRDSLLPTFGDRLQIIFSNEQYLEILPKEAGKGNALRFLTARLPASPFHTYAAGDAENDISMLEAAGTAVAMANASPEVKACADMVTVKNNEEDGLLEIIDCIEPPIS